AYRAQGTVAQVIDIVHRTEALAQLQQVANGGVEVIGIESAFFQIGSIVLVIELDIEFQAPDAAEVVFARIKEHAMEQGRGGIQSGRIARTQLAINLDQGFLWGLDRVTAQSGADYVAHIIALREEDMDLFDTRIHELGELIGWNLAVGLQQDVAGVDSDHIP